MTHTVTAAQHFAMFQLKRLRQIVRAGRSTPMSPPYRTCSATTIKDCAKLLSKVLAARPVLLDASLRPYPLIQFPSRNHFVTMYFVPRTTGMPSCSVF